jgi:hypothetical protein
MELVIDAYYIIKYLFREFIMRCPDEYNIIAEIFELMGTNAGISVLLFVVICFIAWKLRSLVENEKHTQRVSIYNTQ